MLLTILNFLASSFILAIKNKQLVCATTYVLAIVRVIILQFGEFLTYSFYFYYLKKYKASVAKIKLLCHDMYTHNASSSSLSWLLTIFHSSYVHNYAMKVESLSTNENSIYITCGNHSLTGTIQDAW